MTKSRIIVGASAVIAAFAFAPAPTSAQSGSGAPLALDQFTKPHRTAKSVHAHRKTKKTTAVAKAVPEPIPAPQPEAEAPAAATPATAATSSEAATAAPKLSETDGIAVANPDDWNELDAQADDVKVVSGGELNEIDLTAGPPLPADAQAGNGLQSMASADNPDDTSWIGKLLAAIGGTLAMVAAARLLFPRRAPRRS